jgi:tetratricopeptide (TPR) repeat protein
MRELTVAGQSKMSSSLVKREEEGEDRGVLDERWLARRQEAEEKRRDMEEHYHKNIWTKDPHGGRYRRSTGPDARRGYDALEEWKDGSKVEPDLGYEKPQIGPTSNFVGNHMTQGAIDLIQSQLSRKDRAHEAGKLQQYQSMYHPPKKILPSMAKLKGGETKKKKNCEENPSEARTAAAAAGGVVVAPSPPDLGLLRQAIREQRKHKKPGDGKLFDENVLLQGRSRQKQQDISFGEDSLADGNTLDMDEIEAKLVELLEIGDYGTAAKYYTHALSKLDAANFDKRARMLLKRSWCWCQMGEMKRAILDAEECSTMQVQGLEEETLVAMAKLYESVEDYQKAMDCLRNLSLVNPKHNALARLSFIRRSLQQQQKDTSKGNGAPLHPSIPRRTLPRFENRGKSGAAF